MSQKAQLAKIIPEVNMDPLKELNQMIEDPFEEAADK